MPNTEIPQRGGPQTRPNLPSTGVPNPTEPGPLVAPHLPDQQPSETGLPAGVHPMDQAGDDEFPQGQETSGAPYKKGRKPFAQPNSEAFPVNQRSAHDWRAGVTIPNTNNGGTAQVVGRRPGRVSLKIWVPSLIVVGGAPPAAPSAGVMVAATEGELQQYGGVILNIGDSMTIESEASAWVGLVPGSNIGYCQWLDLFDAPGGGITGNT